MGEASVSTSLRFPKGGLYTEEGEAQAKRIGASGKEQPSLEGRLIDEVPIVCVKQDKRQEYMGIRGRPLRFRMERDERKVRNPGCGQSQIESKPGTSRNRTTLFLSLS